jgi:hypothetical protein
MVLHGREFYEIDKKHIVGTGVQTGTKYQIKPGYSSECYFSANILPKIPESYVSYQSNKEFKQ